MYIVCVLFSKQFCVWCLDHKSYDKCGCYGFPLCSPESYPNLLQLYLYYLRNYTLHCPCWLCQLSAIYYLYLQVMFHEKDFLFRVSVIVLFVKNVSNLFQVTEALSLVIKLAEYLAKLPKVSVDLTIRQTVHNKLHGIE